jgi:Cof subfamily protein (haloacid dehalogenase superfamily)
MKSKLISLDIDGTIIDKMAGLRVPAAVREAINEARENGAKVCLCSSRPTFFMSDATKDLDEVDALIGCSGAEIEIEGKIFHRDMLPAPLAKSCVRIASEGDFYLSFPGDGIFYARNKNHVESAFVYDPLFNFMDADDLLIKLEKTPVFCGYIFTDPGMPKDFITESPALTGATVQYSGESSFIITDKGIDKSSGLLRLAKHWNIPKEEILAVGNDENDISMLKVAGVSVAVGNANPILFEYVDWIAPDVKNGGAAEAIRRYAL